MLGFGPKVITVVREALFGIREGDKESRRSGRSGGTGGSGRVDKKFAGDVVSSRCEKFIKGCGSFDREEAIERMFVFA